MSLLQSNVGLKSSSLEAKKLNCTFGRITEWEKDKDYFPVPPRRRPTLSTRAIEDKTLKIRTS
jgi:hypothetical protein